MRRLLIYALLAACLIPLAPGKSGAVGVRVRGQALQFGISGNFSLEEFAGATLAYQRNVTADLAWRLSLGVDAQRNYGEGSYVQVDGDEIDSVSDLDGLAGSVFIAAEWLAYRGEDVALYLGGGPRLSYSKSQADYTQSYSGVEREIHTRSTTLEAGLRGCVGVQWTACEWLAIHAEYSGHLSYVSDLSMREERDADPEEEYWKRRESVDSFVFHSQGVRLGLSVYF